METWKYSRVHFVIIVIMVLVEEDETGVVVVKYNYAKIQEAMYYHAIIIPAIIIGVPILFGYQKQVIQLQYRTNNVRNVLRREEDSKSKFVR